MKILTGGELVVDCLVDQGVKYVFSIIGGQMGTIYDAIGDNPAIDVITPRSETTTAIMACGYTASTGEPAVSMATVGAGVVYEVAGLLKAWLNYLPIVSIAPQVQSYKMKPHQENLQACEQDELFAPITKFNAIVYHWERIPQMIHRAFREAHAGIPGPVHLDIPVDVLFRHQILTRAQKRLLMVSPQRSRYIGPIMGDAEAIEDAAKAVKNAKKPVVIVGQGIGRAGRYQKIRQVLNNMDIPVITTCFSSGILCGADSCFAGEASMFISSEEGLKLLAQADLLVVVGTDPQSDRIALLAGARAEKQGIVQVETDPAAFYHSPGTLSVFADPQSALEAFYNMISQKKGRRPVAWKKRFFAAADKIAENLLKQAGEKLEIAFSMLEKDSDKDTIFIADGEPASYASAFLKNTTHKGLYVMDQSDMSGAGLPFALGVTLGNPNTPVVLICDKESLFHHLRELQPAVSLGLGITILCIDKAPDKVNAVDTQKVLEGLGCHVHKAGAKPGISDVLRHKGQPGAVLI